MWITICVWNSVFFLYQINYLQTSKFQLENNEKHINKSIYYYIQRTITRRKKYANKWQLILSWAFFNLNSLYQPSLIIFNLTGSGLIK